MFHSFNRRGFTLVELITVMAIIGLVASLLLSAVQNSREAARRLQCSNNVKQIGLAIQSYHSAFNQLPKQGGGTGISPGVACIQSHSNRTSQSGLSVFVGLLPYLDQQPLWDQVSSPSNVDAMGNSPPQVSDLGNGPFPAMGPAPSTGRYSYEPWNTELSVLRCVSDPGVGRPAVGRTNYAACIGDNAMFTWLGPIHFFLGEHGDPEAKTLAGVQRYCRGPFVARTVTSFKDITDGLSNTILMGEIATDIGDGDYRTEPSFGNDKMNLFRPGPSTCREEGQTSAISPTKWSSSGRSTSLGPDPDPWPARLGKTARRGSVWASYANLFTGMTTTLPPNSELCLAKSNEWTEGNFSASSRHPGGAHVAMSDGSVRFVSDSIDNGDPAYPGGIIRPGQESPYGVWGALGTRAMREVASVTE
ncbi:MAG: DUF1559 domain-containing protein [Planctomycetota bacterium]